MLYGNFFIWRATVLEIQLADFAILHHISLSCNCDVGANYLGNNKLCKRLNQKHLVEYLSHLTNVTALFARTNFGNTNNYTIGWLWAPTITQQRPFLRKRTFPIKIRVTSRETRGVYFHSTPFTFLCTTHVPLSFQTLHSSPFRHLVTFPIPSRFHLFLRFGVSISHRS